MEGTAWHALAALGACATTLLALSLGLGRLRALRQPAARKRMLRVLESAALPSACSLHLVAVADRYFVVGRSSANLTLLCELPGDRIAAHAHPDRG
jgi:flagellar biogenesis protein FliO